MVRTFEHPSDTGPPADGKAPVDAPRPTNGNAPNKDRRRPGRVENVNPALLPLLRQDRLLEDAAVQRDDDDLAPARGIGIGVLLGVLLWGGVALLAFSLLRG